MRNLLLAAVVPVALIFAINVGVCSADLVDEMPIRDVATALKDKATAGIQKLLFKAGPFHMAVAGMHQFSETWVRDVCHSSIGLLTRATWEVDGQNVSSTKIVKDIVLAFLGEITPQKTLSPRVLDSLQPSFGIDSEEKLKLKVIRGSAALTKDYEMSEDIVKTPDFPGYPFVPCYEGESGVKTTIDSNYWLLRAFARYAGLVETVELERVLASNSSGGMTVAEKLRLTLGYLASEDHWQTLQGIPFLTQGAFAEWKDSIKQIGVSSFTNLQFVEALEAMFSIPALQVAMEGAALYAKRFGSSKYSHMRMGAMPEVLAQWKRDIIAVFKQANGLLQESSSVPSISHIDGHLQWFRVAREPEFKQTVRFEDVVSNFVTYDANGTITNLPGTPNGVEWPYSEVAPEKRLIGLANYHGSLAWSWLVGSFAHEAHMQGNITLRDGVLRWLLKAQLSIPSSGFSNYISEIYKEGKIMAGFPYTSETPFMWGSNYVLWAVDAILADESSKGLPKIAQKREKEAKVVV